MKRFIPVLTTLIVLSVGGNLSAQNHSDAASSPVVKAGAPTLPAAVTIPPAPRPNDPPKPKQPGLRRA